jgi:hypothetical protein
MSLFGFGGDKSSGFEPSGGKLTQNQMNARLELTKLNLDYKDKIWSRWFSPNFFAYTLVSLVVIAGIICIVKVKEFDKWIEFWKVIIPVITTYIGFAIGKQSKKEPVA